MRIPSGVTDQYIYFVAVDATDLKTRETGLTGFTVYRSRDGGAAASMTPTINETDSTNMPGVYELLLNSDMTIAAGNDSEEMVFHITHANMAPVTRVIEIYRPKITAGNTLGVAADGDISGNLDGTVATVTTLTGHTPQTGDSYARLGAPVGASISADIAVIEGYTDDIGVAGAGLTAIPYNNAWDADIESEVTDALNAYGPATPTQVNAEVLDVLNTDTFGEPTGVPGATVTLATKVGYLYMALRNQVTVSSTKKTFFDDGGVAEWEKDLSDSGSLYTETEANAI